MENNREEIERVAHLRQMARKLARNRSGQRVIRKLPQSIEIVVLRPKRAIHARTVLNDNKRMAYMLLLGAVSFAYLFEMDSSAWERAFESLQAAQAQLGTLAKTIPI